MLQQSLQRKITTMKNLIHSKFLAFVLSIVLLLSACVSAATEPLPADTVEANVPLVTDVSHTIAEVEELAGFAVKQPSYLPTGVSFDYATYQEAPHPNVTLHFKLTH